MRCQSSKHLQTTFMTKYVLLFLLLVNSTQQLFAQKTDKKLQAKVEALVRGFNGDVGVYIYNLKSNKTVAVNADSLYPTASMIKMPILLGIMTKFENKELQYHQQLTYKDSLLYAGEDILGSFKNNETIELSKVLMLMLTMSDNTASLWLQSLAGGGLRINQQLDSIGLQSIRVNSRTPGREANREQYGWGQTTPREMATLMKMIATKKLINPEASSKMLRLLSRNYWDEEALSQIPAGVFVASKSGAVDASRSEVLYVNGKHCEYVFCICTTNNKDTSWQSNNEAWTLTRTLSKFLWDYYK